MTDAEQKMLELRRAAYAAGLVVSNDYVFSNLNGVISEEHEKELVALNERMVQVSRELGLT